jgi:hypothetical protein
MIIIQVASGLTLLIWCGFGGTGWSVYWSSAMGAASSALGHYTAAFGLLCCAYAGVALRVTNHLVTDFVQEEEADAPLHEAAFLPTLATVLPPRPQPHARQAAAPE